MSIRKRFLEELKESSLKELQEREQKISREIFLLKSKEQVDKRAEKPHLFRELKKNRARVLTLIREKGVK